MARSVNKVTLVGTVGRDPDISDMKEGKVAFLSLATTRDGGPERTDWHRLTFRNRLAQFVQDYVTKGDRIYVEGRLEYDSYERDGITIPTADVNVKEVVFLSAKRSPGRDV